MLLKNEKVIDYISLEEYLNFLKKSYISKIFNKKTRRNFFRYKMFKKFGFKCQHCSAIGIEVLKIKDINEGEVYKVITIDNEGNENFLTIDHIIPKSKNGKNNIKNVQPLCYTCNNKKGNLILK